MECFQRLKNLVIDLGREIENCEQKQALQDAYKEKHHTKEEARVRASTKERTDPRVAQRLHILP